MRRSLKQDMDMIQITVHLQDIAVPVLIYDRMTDFK